ncbi:hypothetical protein N7517_000227 [Penicillium concentricum]|uniref:Lipocalin-like domain-containing protein n=1 Tax=Penicillium concentricum TaxID=293559 RepID=A0A9W9VK47_9EURO|nr:uncharacterized protein N7517_000227 [Penicillium concentricum]KAJ5382316.1 hypothetical protein N7517_000227 [Penicillium concentricum]
MSSIAETRQSLVGTWSLVEYKAVRADNGFISHPMGPKAQGFLIYSPEGFVSAYLMEPEALEFSDAEVGGGTKDELYRAMKHYLAYCGRFELAELDGVVLVTHHMDVCSFPNWLGSAQERVIKLTGNLLEINTAEPVLYGGHFQHGSLVWQKS